MAKWGSLSALQNTHLTNQQHTYVTVFLSPKVTLKHNTNIQQHIAQTAVNIEIQTINTMIMLQN